MRRVLKQEMCHVRRPPRHGRGRQLGRQLRAGQLHNFHQLYLFTDAPRRAGGSPAASRPRAAAPASRILLARPLHRVARPPVWRAVVRPARSFFVCVLRAQRRHPAALLRPVPAPSPAGRLPPSKIAPRDFVRERAVLPHSIPEPPGTARGPLHQSLFGLHSLCGDGLLSTVGRFRF